jgi:eukaryotic-like serine/threonine-protein kinase
MLTDGWLGRFKIVNKIGSGGMGEVYLCEDPKLNRQIALKTLPADVASDSARMHRFISEAKSASALNHPNIITIYEINDDHETPFIAMEYVRGETLGKAIRRGPMDVAVAMDVASQVAGALAAAHEANIVHRDIKPDNIIIRPDGLVKVLDFGLAKLTENDGSSDPEAETIAHRTNPGMILGTASYMSPEQARGKDVDGRSDIFSFGTVLFQMLSGKLPFTGENYVDVIGAILHKEPASLVDLVPDIPHDVDGLVRKCLRKNRDERYQTVREMLADLKEMRSELNLEFGSLERAARVSDPGFKQSTASGIARAQTTAGHSGFATSSISKLIDEFKLHPMRAGTLVILGLAVLIAAGSWMANSGPGSLTAEAFQRMRFTRATTSGDIVTEQVALSPDGKYVAYVYDVDGLQGLSVKQVEVQSIVELAPPAKVQFLGVTFSPNGNHVYYSIEDGEGTGSLFEVPVLGGTPRRIRSHIRGHLAFSPDNRRFAYVKDETQLVVSSLDGNENAVVAESGPGDRWIVTAWSPDSTRLGAAIYSASDSRCRLVEVDLATGTVQPIPTPPWLRIGGVKWLPDGTGLVMTARDIETELSQVWFVSYPDGAVRKITSDPNSYQGISVSADGKSIATVRQERLVNIWTAGAAGSGLSSRVTRDLGRDEGMSGVSWMPDGRIVYTVRLAGNQDLWITGDPQQQLTFDSDANFSPAVSPDGRYIVFISSRSGNPALWRVDSNGENGMKLADHKGIAGEPEFTPDGQWVVYDVTDENNKTTVWKVRIDGKEPVQLTDYESGRPEVSPDGRMVAVVLWGDAKTRSKLGIISIEGGEPMRILDYPEVVNSRNFRWSNDGTGFVFIRNVDKTFNIWQQPIDGGEPKQITNFDSERIFRFDLSRVTGEFALARGSETSDVVVINDFR